MVSTTKEKMVAGAADLISRRGVGATSLRNVVDHTGTPRGSLAHHFPRGKQQMLEEAVQYADEAVAAPLAALLLERGPEAGLQAFIAWWRRILEVSGFEAGCPVLAVAVEPMGGAETELSTDDLGEEGGSNPQERLRALVHGAFTRWQAIFSDSLISAGVEPARAARLAALVVASVEGTVAMCRAARSTAALDDVARELRDILVQAIAQSRRG